MAQRYADWMYADEAYAIDSEIEAICASLEGLKRDYGRYLDEDGIRGNIACLSNWLHNYSLGSYDAQTYLRDYGASLLHQIHDSLNLAADDMRRFDSESPAAQNFTGGRADRLNKAATEVAAMQQHIERVFHSVH